MIGLNHTPVTIDYFHGNMWKDRIYLIYHGNSILIEKVMTGLQVSINGVLKRSFTAKIKDKEVATACLFVKKEIDRTLSFPWYLRFFRH